MPPDNSSFPTAELQPTNQPRSPAKTAYIVFALFWLACLLALFIGDRDTAYLALSTLGYSVLLGGLALWLLPKPAAVQDELNATQPAKTLTARTAVALLVYSFALLVGIAYGGIQGGIYIPGLTPLLAALGHTYLPWHDNANSLSNFVTLALIPIVLFLALGQRPRSLGLNKPVKGTLAATIACLIVPIGMTLFALANHRIALVGLLFLLIHNLFSNGFSEEFFARGMIFSYLRVRLDPAWALMSQAALWALVHLGTTIGEEHWHPVLVVANVIALNMPMGVALGIMAVRSRSLVLPSIVHISLDTMSRLVSGH